MPRTLDTSRSYGLLCPPGPGGHFVQDNLCFDANGREVTPPAPAAEVETPVVVSEASLPTDKADLVQALRDLDVGADRRMSVPKLQAMLREARSGT